MAKKAAKKRTAKKMARRAPAGRVKATKRSKRPRAGSAKKSVARKTTKKASPRRKTTAVRSGRSSAKSSSRSRSGAKTSSTGGKVGSSPRAAARMGGRDDFGIPPERARERAMQGEDLLHREGGGPRSLRGEMSGDRESGAGAPDSGPGSSSGGDLDVDIVGVGTGAGLAQSGPDELGDIGLAETDGSSDEFASGPPALGENQPNKNDE